MDTNGPGASDVWYLRRLCRMFAAAAAVLLAIVAWHQYHEATYRPAAEGQVRDLLQAQEAAWNRGDLDGFMAGYRMSDDITFYSDDKIQPGWLALRERYEKKYRAGGQGMGKLTFSDLVVDVLAPNAALARGRWKVELDGKTPSGLFTILLRKFPDGWKVVHDHTSAAKDG